MFVVEDDSRPVEGVGSRSVEGVGPGKEGLRQGDLWPRVLGK